MVCFFSAWAACIILWTDQLAAANGEDATTQLHRTSASVDTELKAPLMRRVGSSHVDSLNRSRFGHADTLTRERNTRTQATSYISLADDHGSEDSHHVAQPLGLPALFEATSWTSPRGYWINELEDFVENGWTSTESFPVEFGISRIHVHGPFPHGAVSKLYQDLPPHDTVAMSVRYWVVRQNGFGTSGAIKIDGSEVWAKKIGKPRKKKICQGWLGLATHPQGKGSKGMVSRSCVAEVGAGFKHSAAYLKLEFGGNLGKKTIKKKHAKKPIFAFSSLQVVVGNVKKLVVDEGHHPARDWTPQTLTRSASKLSVLHGSFAANTEVSKSFHNLGLHHFIRLSLRLWSAHRRKGDGDQEDLVLIGRKEAWRQMRSPKGLCAEGWHETLPTSGKGPLDGFRCYRDIVTAVPHRDKTATVTIKTIVSKGTASQSLGFSDVKLWVGQATGRPCSHQACGEGWVLKMAVYREGPAYCVGNCDQAECCNKLLSAVHPSR